VLAAVLVGGCAARSARPPAGGDLARALSGLVWPLRFDEARNVRSRYGYRGEGPGVGRYHYGLDLRAVRGEPVYSAGAGVVADAGAAGAYGRFVRVEHGGGLESFYAHLDRILARRGDSVRRGQVIGLAGSTGNATGPHLHFELRWRGRWVDPLAVLPALR
jgi:murein DD-endopeptidase MepM/ murein hydrolase activator NlpD